AMGDVDEAIEGGRYSLPHRALVGRPIGDADDLEPRAIVQLYELADQTRCRMRMIVGRDIRDTDLVVGRVGTAARLGSPILNRLRPCTCSRRLVAIGGIV